MILLVLNGILVCTIILFAAVTVTTLVGDVALATALLWLLEFAYKAVPQSAYIAVPAANLVFWIVLKLGRGEEKWTKAAFRLVVIGGANLVAVALFLWLFQR